MAKGIDALHAELLRQRNMMVEREPAHARVLELLAEALNGSQDGSLAQQLQRIWSEREFSALYERPLLLLAALRYDALCEGPTHPLYAAIGGSPPQPSASSTEALGAALADSRTRFWQALRERAVQTNETTRAVIWLWPAQLLASAGEQRPLALVDLGTSAGLNLIADRLPTPWVDQQGTPVLVTPRPRIAARLGFDRSPLDVRRDDDARWLRACVWPHDSARLERLSQAVACMRSAAAGPDAPRIETCGLLDVPPKLDALPRDVLVLCMQSLVRDYLPPDDRMKHAHGMREFLVRRPRSALWVQLEPEPDGTSLDDAASIRVDFARASGELRSLVLARTHPHPRRLLVDANAVATFQAELAR